MQDNQQGPTAGIVGAGLAGRLLAHQLLRLGWKVELYDRDDTRGSQSCSYASAGMLAPSCELETADFEINTLGTTALQLWPRILDQLDTPVFYRQLGSLVVAHPHDAGELNRLKSRILDHPRGTGMMEEVDQEALADLEPELAGRFTSGLYMKNEAHIDNRDTLRALGLSLQQQDVPWHTGIEIEKVEPHQVQVNGSTNTFDWVIDCRGMGAKKDLPDLRGVRGETVLLDAPDVHLERPVRLMHPRYAVYIVPRAEHRFLVGATSIESEDYSPVSVRSALELLSAAYSLHSGFAEGRVLEMTTHCRPAFPDNRPRILVEDGLMRINGLYRHGFLLSPVLIEFACEILAGKPVPENAASVVKERS